MNEPKIRFKGFQGEWETSIIGDIATFSKGRGYSKSDLRSEGNPIVLYGRLYTNYASVIESVDTFASLQNGSVITKGNEVIIPGSGETPEDIAIASAVEQKGVILGGDINVLSFDQDKIVPTFAAMSITNSKTHYELSGYAQGKTVVHLHNSSISKGHISYPYIDEQRAIASYFQHLDALIQSTTKKIESLKQVKAASLQSMFPQEGETTPRVRFKGFEGEWKKVKFGEIAIISRGLTYAPFNLRDKGVRVLRSSNINEDVFVISENDVFVNEECINIEYAEEGNILVTAANGSPRLVGKHAIINNIGTNTTVVGGFMLLISSNESAFLNASMSSSWYSKFLKVGVAGGNGAIGNLSKQELEDTELLIPNKKDERNYIASYFTNLDRQITLHTQRLEKLKQIKSACLDNMFV